MSLDRVEQLAKVELFSGLKPAALDLIAKVAVEQGMKNLRGVALDKVREGISTLEQVLVLTSSH